MIKAACEPVASVEELIEKHDRIASYHAAAIWRQKYRSGVTQDDLYAAGMVGLWEAAQRYDPSRNAKFSTFCVLRVRGAIYDWIRKASHGSRHDPRENDSLDRVLFTSRRGRDVTHKDGLADGRKFETEMATDEFWDRIARGLSQTERAALELYYRHGETMKAVADRLGFCESRIGPMRDHVRKFLSDKYRHDHRGDLTNLLFQELPGAIPCPTRSD